MKMTESEYRTLINEKAKKVESMDQLKTLIEEIEAYEHDYGTIVVGCFAAMLGAFNVVNRGPSGGITGFQAGCLGWEAIKEFMSLTKDAPVRLVDFANMLYPQYADKFDRSISKETWKYLQEKAVENLAKENQSAHPNVVNHWKSISMGNVPFGYSVKE